MATETLRLLIVDDHEVVRRGLKTLLSRCPVFQIVGEAATVRAAIALASRLQPDMVLMDVRLPDGSGIEACREIMSQRPEARVVMLTSFADEDAVFSAIMAGARGYVLKDVRGRELIKALERVASGESLLDPGITQPILERLRGAAEGRQEDLIDSLTQTERQILRLIADGKTNRAIARDLYLSDKTVKNYVSRTLTKLHLQRRAQAAAYFARREMQEHPKDFR